MSVNKVILIGHLGGDPETKFTPDGTLVCKFNIATSERFTDRAGDRQERTEWHGITAWAKLAELCQEWLCKGSRVYVEGSLRREKYETKAGEKREHTRIIAREVTFLSGGKKRQGGSGPANEPPFPESAPSGPPVSDDDIPF